MRTRNGLDWTEDFAAIAEAARGLENCILDGEVVALDHNGAPDFAALQAVLSDGQSRTGHILCSTSFMLPRSQLLKVLF